MFVGQHPTLSIMIQYFLFSGYTVYFSPALYTMYKIMENNVLICH